MKQIVAIIMLLAVSVFTVHGQKSVYNRKDKFGSGSLKISKLIKNKSFNFSISVGRSGKSFADYCVGEITGKAIFITSKVAEYESDDEDSANCRVTFVFEKNKIIVKESKCNYFHGVMCNFSGKYLL